MHARARLRALMTQTSCAVGMRNAKLGNHLKSLSNQAGRISALPYCHDLGAEIYAQLIRATYTVHAIDLFLVSRVHVWTDKNCKAGCISSRLAGY